MAINSNNIYQLARLALKGDREDIHTYIRRLASRLSAKEPQFADKLNRLLESAPSPWRQMTPVPIDADSHLSLARIEHCVSLDTDPVLEGKVLKIIDQLLDERKQATRLLEEGVPPSKSVLFTGPPGVGKTMTAHWIAQRLEKTLITLDLSAVMSSYLGKTGINVRNVLDYAKSQDCILLLDEFDAIAKRRDDDSEIGELKRLVNVLLQEVDQWPDTGLLIAATNHGALLDPAAWRRFDLIINFTMPSINSIEKIITTYWGKANPGDHKVIKFLSHLWADQSPSDIYRNISNLKRKAVLSNRKINDIAFSDISSEISSKDKDSLKKIIPALLQNGYSQRELSRITGIARNTISKIIKQSES